MNIGLYSNGKTMYAALNNDHWRCEIVFCVLKQ